MSISPYKCIMLSHHGLQQWATSNMINICRNHEICTKHPPKIPRPHSMAPAPRYKWSDGNMDPGPAYQFETPPFGGSEYFSIYILRQDKPDIGFLPFQIAILIDGISGGPDLAVFSLRAEEGKRTVHRDFNLVTASYCGWALWAWWHQIRACHKNNIKTPFFCSLQTPYFWGQRIRARAGSCPPLRKTTVWDKQLHRPQVCHNYFNKPQKLEWNFQSSRTH